MKRAELHDNSVTLQRSIFVKLSYFLKKKNRNINLFLHNVETKKNDPIREIEYPKIYRYQFGSLEFYCLGFELSVSIFIRVEWKPETGLFTYYSRAGSRFGSRA